MSRFMNISEHLISLSVSCQTLNRA